jgi:hypothetical protein
MASLDDLLTASKNIVTALNGINGTFAKFLGNVTSTTITSSTLVATGSGRLVNFVVLVAGTGNGAIYNTTNSASPPAANELVVIPQTIGVYPVGAAFTNGLLVVPGTGQTVTVTYYLG